MSTTRCFHYLMLGCLSVFCLLLATCSSNGSLCPPRQVTCQVFLTQGSRNPYRDNPRGGLTAPYTGWHYAGQVPVDACWQGFPKMCDFCNLEASAYQNVCNGIYPGYSTRTGPLPVHLKK